MGAAPVLLLRHAVVRPKGLDQHVHLGTVAAMVGFSWVQFLVHYLAGHLVICWRCKACPFSAGVAQFCVFSSHTAPERR